MSSFLILCALALLAVFAFGVLVIPILILGGLVWVITLPFRLFFGLVFGLFGLFFGLVFGLIRLVFGIVAGLLGLVLAPFLLLVLGALLVGALFVGLLSFLLPVLPLVLLGLLVWAAFRAVQRRPSPTF